jgi:hypothetical protein
MNVMNLIIAINDTTAIAGTTGIAGMTDTAGMTGITGTIIIIDTNRCILTGGMGTKHSRRKN